MCSGDAGPDNVIVSGSINTICPGEIGLFKCSTIDEQELNWLINSVPVAVFGGFAEIADGPISMDNTIAYLVARDVRDLNIGNRTSILEYTPDTSTSTYVTIECVTGPDIFSREIFNIGEFYVVFSLCTDDNYVQR